LWDEWDRCDEKTLRHCLRVAETFGKDEIVSTTRRAYLGRLGRLDCHEQAICRKETGDKEVEREEIARVQSNLPSNLLFEWKVGRLDLGKATSDRPSNDRPSKEGEVITLLQLMEPMFELGFLDVSDMRWRAPTKTFRKKGE